LGEKYSVFSPQVLIQLERNQKMKCPECGREYPSSEVMCDCGYIFEKEDLDAPDQEA
jgi:hypothetical protein